ncbi:hypothetical protein N7489_009542 [Penicillium chrysogenum]|uniref:uncharacterized protein n=1 Tax=Penicillium chrysogenum TaxID=5076 RepID=UPI0024DF0BD9|nr:uncharacterized protein N7489_009542 [Penicillium chrysogenum]KAJ5228834.1 hypothetical protein N7489_009542 [Penicillium chrysogenum]
MALSTGHVASQLRHLIYYQLDNNLIRNALFLASRLHAYEPRSFEAQFLLALCHLHNGEVKAAFECSQASGSRGLHAGCAYVFAQACLDLGKYLDGVTALERSKSLWASKNHWNKHSETQRQHLPDAAAVYSLQGKLWHAHKDLTKAVDCYVEALKLNPFMWDAFLGLCETGVNIRVPNIFQLSPELLAIISSSPEEIATAPDNVAYEEGTFPVQPPGNPESDPFMVSASRGESDATFGSSALWEKLNGSSANFAAIAQPVFHDGMETPGAQSSGSDDFRIANGVTDPEAGWEAPLAPARKTRTIQTMSLDHTGQPPPRMRPTGIRPRHKTRTEPETQPTAPVERDPSLVSRFGDRKRTVSGQVAHPLPSSQPTEPGAPQRRSVRLFNQIKPTTSKLSNGTLTGRDGREMKKLRGGPTKGRAGSAPTVGRVVSGNRKPVETPDNDGKDNRTGLSQSHSTAPPLPKNAEKTKELEALDWLLGLFNKLASGYFALSRYKCADAISSFNSLSQGQRETPWVLSQLGRTYFEQASYTEAAKYFSRVQKLAPSRIEDMEIYSTVLWHLKSDVELAYLAHQLLEADRLSPSGVGHEYVANEEYDKALEAYRHGINADNRHYNAWYGLGTVYDKMGKLDFAEQHFRNAASINPTNAVLICCIGLVLEKMNNPQDALVHYAKFRKARVLMKLREYKFALAELKVLKDMAPDEANVHYLLGKLYKMLHDKANAIKHFTAALNLDPKAAQYIKDAMESLDDDDMEDEDIA